MRLGTLLLLTGCAVWMLLNTLPADTPESVNPSESALEPPRTNKSLRPTEGATPQPEVMPQAQSEHSNSSIMDSETPEKSEIPPVPIVPMPQPETFRVSVHTDVDGYPVMARLTIEAIGLELPVIAEFSDDALKTAPCLYAGPGTPKDVGNIVVVGHNYQDDSHFGKLDELEVDVLVRLTDDCGEIYDYEVYSMETIAPDQAEALADYEGERSLSLITCTTSGKNRLLVKCRQARDLR